MLVQSESAIRQFSGIGRRSVALRELHFLALAARQLETVAASARKPVRSSHSGRRTFITNAAPKISTVGGSLKDVQELAGHANLRTTQRYIEANPDAQVRVVGLV